MGNDRFIFLDRDGVVNADSDNYIRNESDWVPIPGSIDAIVNLSHAGFRIAIVSNQSGLARGYFDIGTLNAMHRKLRDLISFRGGRIEMIVFCPHIPDDGCNCRKPLPGMFEQVQVRAGIDLHGIPFIGDSLKDIQAARQLNMVPVLVRTGKGIQALESGGILLNELLVYDDLKAASDDLIKH
jgi:D-glycero-D-manno-heptose 1,7-bisphosphate phosphatase